MSGYRIKASVLIYTSIYNFPPEFFFFFKDYIYTTFYWIQLPLEIMKSQKQENLLDVGNAAFPFLAEHLKRQNPTSGFIHDCFFFQTTNPWSVFPHFPSLNSPFFFLTFSCYCPVILACDIYIVLSCKWISSGPWMVWELHYTSRWLSL